MQSKTDPDKTYPCFIYLFILFYLFIFFFIYFFLFIYFFFLFFFVIETTYMYLTFSLEVQNLEFNCSKIIHHRFCSPFCQIKREWAADFIDSFVVSCVYKTQGACATTTVGCQNYLTLNVNFPNTRSPSIFLLSRYVGQYITGTLLKNKDNLLMGIFFIPKLTKALSDRKW